MPTFNKGTFMGHLGQDPELRRTPSGAAVANGSICSTRKYKTSSGEKREEPTWMDYEIWGKQAETLYEYSKKGDTLLFEYRLKQDRWQNEAGENRSKIKMVVLGLTFIKKKGDHKRQDETGDDAGGERTESCESEVDDGGTTPF